MYGILEVMKCRQQQWKRLDYELKATIESKEPKNFPCKCFFLAQSKIHLNTNGTIQKLLLITQRHKGYKGNCNIYFSSI